MRRSTARRQQHQAASFVSSVCQRPVTLQQLPRPERRQLRQLASSMGADVSWCLERTELEDVFQRATQVRRAGCAGPIACTAPWQRCPAGEPGQGSRQHVLTKMTVLGRVQLVPLGCWCRCASVSVSAVLSSAARPSCAGVRCLSAQAVGVLSAPPGVWALVLWCEGRLALHALPAA